MAGLLILSWGSEWDVMGKPTTAAQRKALFTGRRVTTVLRFDGNIWCNHASIRDQCLFVKMCSRKRPIKEINGFTVLQFYKDFFVKLFKPSSNAEISDIKQAGALGTYWVSKCHFTQLVKLNMNSPPLMSVTLSHFSLWHTETACSMTGSRKSYHGFRNLRHNAPLDPPTSETERGRCESIYWNAANKIRTQNRLLTSKVSFLNLCNPHHWGDQVSQFVARSQANVWRTPICPDFLLVSKCPTF